MTKTKKEVNSMPHIYSQIYSIKQTEENKNAIITADAVIKICSSFFFQSTDRETLKLD